MYKRLLHVSMDKLCSYVHNRTQRCCENSCKSMQSSLLLTGSTVAISLGRPKRVKGFSLKSLQLKILWCNQLWAALSAGVTGRAIQ